MLRVRNYLEFWEKLPENERIITDVLRQIILENLPIESKEKLAYNVPCYYGNKRICMIWPASVPRGGVASGVLLGFGRGYQLQDHMGYLTHGTNKRIFYKIFQSVDEIDVAAITVLLREAVSLDKRL